jgi:DNA-binding XRE family transcriptional regulator
LELLDAQLGLGLELSHLTNPATKCNIYIMSEFEAPEAHPGLTQSQELQMRLRANLKRLRQDAKLSQREIAIILGVGRAEVIHLEKGRRKISIEYLYKLSKHFNVSIDMLVNGSPIKTLGDDIFNLTSHWHRQII